MSEHRGPWSTPRSCAPDQTLARLLPRLPELGITRCAEVTGLDVDLGVPVYVAIRPHGRVLQSSAGKGLDAVAAKVSALMEALEYDVAERTELGRLRRASQQELLAEGARVETLPEWTGSPARYFGERFRIDWLEGEELLNGGALWLPAGAAYFCEPTPCRTNTNGLASGNDLAEATLHGLLEVIERDAVARLIDGEHLDVARSCEVLDPSSITAPELAAVISAIERASTKVVLLRLRSGVSLPVVWAVLLNRKPFASSSTFNAGFGAALDVRGAVARAVSEAVQSRLTMIHGARDDIVAKPAYRGGPDPRQVLDSSAYRFFDGLQPSARLDDDGLDHVPGIHESLQIVLARLREAGHERVYRVDLRCPVEGFSVVKIIAPSLRFDSALC